MKKVIRIDETGMFVEDVILNDEETTPSDCVEIECKSGFYHPKWNGTAWVEGLAQEQIDAIVNVSQPLSELDEIRLAMAELASMIAGGVVNG